MENTGFPAYVELGMSSDEFKERLIELHQSGKSIRDIEHQLGIGYSTVMRSFRRYGIKTIIHKTLHRMNGFEEKEAFDREVTRLYREEKMPLREVAKRMKTTYVTMQMYFARNGIKTREMSEYVRLADEDIILTEKEQEIIDGCLLGDGSVCPKKHSVYFSYCCKHKSVVEDLAIHLSRLHPKIRRRQYLDDRTNKVYTTFILSTHSFPSFCKVRQKWYPNEKKIVPADVVLTPETCYWWYLGDGSSGNSSLILCTNGFIREDVEMLISKMPITSGLYMQRRRWPIIRITKIEDRIKFLSFIGQCRHPVYNQRWIIHKKGPIFDFCCPEEGSVIKDYILRRLYVCKDGEWVFDRIY